MTATPSIDPEQFLHERLAQASPDLMRELLETFVNALLSAQADSVCGAEYGARSAQRTDRLVRTLGITGLSKSQVSVMAKDLDEQVAAFRTRPLVEGPHTFVAVDALTMKVREGGRVVKVAVMVATGVNAEGYREVLGINTATVESGAGWLGFFRDLLARGLTGV